MTKEVVKLEHFKPAEFREWYDRMSPRLLVMLDVLRHGLNSGISISLSPQALGRELSRFEKSEHNVDFWGEVLAVDCFVAGVFTRNQAMRVVSKAVAIGFTGIGVYEDTYNNAGVPQVMFHLGVRSTRRMGSPAKWGRVAGNYTSLLDAIEGLPYDET